MALIEYLRGVLAARRREPREDLISAMLAAEVGGEGLTEDEMLGTSMVLLAAGHETTTNLIGNGLLTLLRQPEERARLVHDPSLLPSAVEEMLRFESPVQATSRLLPEPLTIDGTTIPARSEIGLLLGAANRDPEVFPEPHRFDVGRRDNRHVAFGFGIHFCPGAGLARLEGRLALGTLLRHAPAPKLVDDTLVWRPGFLFRGVERLRVAW
jgi:cytochrome P450